MAYVKWGLILTVLVVIAGFLHYALPSRDIVRVVGTEVRLQEQTRTDSAGNKVPFQDDVYFIKSVQPNGDARVYRNEDNIWYFKFDSSNLDAEASNLISTSDAPKWVVVTHYGWRITYLSTYPNAIAMRLADGPDEPLTPWFNIVLIVLMIVAVLVIRRVLIILRRRHVDPVVDAIDQEFDETASWWRRQLRRIGLTK